MANLPRAVHLVAKAPQLDVPRLGAPVLAAQIRPLATAWMVHVFDEVPCGIQAARPKIDRQHHVGARRLGPFRELVDTDLVGFGCTPCEIEARRAALLRPYAVFPVVSRHEIAAWIAADRRVEFPHEIDHVLAHAVG